MRLDKRVVAAGALAAAVTVATDAGAEETPVQLGPRPYYLVEQMKDGELKSKLQQCKAQQPERTDFSIGHRGAPLQFPEHTKESYRAAARMGAGILECDVTFTRDRELVCRHSQCDLHRTTNVLAIPELATKCSEPFTPADPATGREASAKCCTSDFTLAEFKRLEGKMDAADEEATTLEAYMNATADWRTDLYAAGTLLTHKESIALFKRLGVKFTPELKAPETAMPHDGDYTRRAYAEQLIREYEEADVDPENVFVQSFNLEDVRYWIETHPEFGAQAVYLDGRYRDRSFDHTRPETWKPGMSELAEAGVNIIAPPMWILVRLDADGTIVPSVYAKAAKDAGLDIVPWTLERAGPLNDGGGWYYQTVEGAISREGDRLVLLDILAKQVGIRGIFSDWPATATYYANCMDLQ